MIALVAAAVGRPQSYTVRWHAETALVSVEVEGLTRDALEALTKARFATHEWAALFGIFAEYPSEPGQPPRPAAPLAGAWKVAGTRLRFEPRLPLQRGLTYRAEFWPMRLPGTLGSPLLLADPRDLPLMLRPVYSFFELPPERAASDPAKWTLELPAAGTRDALTVFFEDTLDRAAAGRLGVFSKSTEAGPGARRAGAAELAEDGRVWRFTPEQAWPRGEFRLVLAPEPVPAGAAAPAPLVRAFAVP